MKEKLLILLSTFVDSSEKDLKLRALGNGHINDTYSILVNDQPKYVLQRINSNVFPEPLKVMENLQNISDFLIPAFPDHKFLTPLVNKENEYYSLDENGDVWRLCEFVAGSVTFDFVQTEAQAEETARAFGEYQLQLLNYNGPELHETIKDFHNTPVRYQNFERAVLEGKSERIEAAQKEISWLRANRHIASRLTDLCDKGDIPLRITHNDSKLQNLLLDEKTQHSLCVVDLDTVMPGLSLYDFGDMMRSTTCLVAEDEEDLSKVQMQMNMFKALARGYYSVAGKFLTSVETANIPFAGILITYENALRFLTDYFMGDVYYKTHKEHHNLLRSRTQIELVKSMQACESEMNNYIETLAVRS
ncbi:MAG: aminoglycoside phosphotransferase family protein [Lentisphaeraceae bacterium]|nr:aminoglycoside phosphotransferase family protein [Lentisphaeraceae bacterium]